MGHKSRRTAKSSAAKRPAAKKAAKRPAAKKAKSEPAKSAAAGIEPLRVTVRRAIVNALEHSHSLREAARALEMPYSSLRDKLYQLQIGVPERSHSRQRASDVLSVDKAKSKAAPKKKAATRKKAAPKKKTRAKAAPKKKAKAAPKTKKAASKRRRTRKK